jgi:hypothetical protein
VLILTMKLWKLAFFAQIWLKKATTSAVLGRTLHAVAWHCRPYNPNPHNKWLCMWTIDITGDIHYCVTEMKTPGSEWDMYPLSKVDRQALYPTELEGNFPTSSGL